jgi:hypothetical protein
VGKVCLWPSWNLDLARFGPLTCSLAGVLLKLQKKNLSLYRWNQEQQYFYQKGLLSKDKIERLDELGFMWSLGDAVGCTGVNGCSYGRHWETHFEALLQYRTANNGRCEVPHTVGEYLSLGFQNWCSLMRSLCMARLLGFWGNVLDTRVDCCTQIEFAVWTR